MMDEIQRRKRRFPSFLQTKRSVPTLPAMLLGYLLCMESSSSVQALRDPHPTMGPGLPLRFRGGGVKSTDVAPRTGRTKSSSSKNQYSRRNRNARSTRSSRGNSSATTKPTEEYAPKAPSIEALLIPRPIKLTWVVHWLAMTIVAISLQACWRTAGEPYSSAVWNLLHTGGNPCPSSYQPSATDQFLARRIAASSSEILPPRHLPSPVPLLSLLGSLLVWITANSLLPRWFTPVHVFLNFRKHHKWNGMAARSVVETVLQQSRSSGGTTLDLSVLVHVPREQRILESRGRSHVVRPLQASPEVFTNDSHLDNSDDVLPFYFDLNHRRIYCDPPRSKCVDGGPTLHTRLTPRHLMTVQSGDDHVLMGLSNPDRLQQAQECYEPYASLTLPTPSVLSAFGARLASPLAVLQLLGRLLSALEEHFLSSLLNLGMTLFHHYWNARQSIVSAIELAKEVQANVQDTSSTQVWALRPRRRSKKQGCATRAGWKQLTAMDLLPGDVFIMDVGDYDKMAAEAFVMPVDGLLLEGSCVMNEAVLTGESVPQSKTPLEIDVSDESAASIPLDLMGAERGSVLFAGTSMLHCTPTSTGQALYPMKHPPLPSQVAGRSVVKVLTLRTGTYSSRGELMRALVKSNVGAISSPQTEKDAIRLIVSLSGCAVAACASLFYGGAHDRKVSSFRRVIQCTRIAVASVPSDLSLALSAVAHTCASKLRKDADVVCSEPGSLLTAAHVDTVVFDKTGTLTADTQSLTSIVPLNNEMGVDPMVDAVLAGCHSIVNLQELSSNEHLVGDPLDISALKHSGWTFDSEQNAFVRESRAIHGEEPVKLWQLKTFPFDASRRTSSAIILVEHKNKDFRLWKVVKGSPEAIRRQLIADDLFTDQYRKKVSSLEADGKRIIALAVAEWKDDSDIARLLFPSGLSLLSKSTGAIQSALQHARHMVKAFQRNSVEVVQGTESGLPFNFVGFACFEAAIRPSTRRVMRELQEAGMAVTMLTGDGIDAAISVACLAGLISSNKIHVVEVQESSLLMPSLVWRTMEISPKKNSQRRLAEVENSKMLSQGNVDDFISCVEKGTSSFVATGDAVTWLMENRNTVTASRVLDSLHRLQVVGRASPKQKQALIACLKQHCGRRVLMCGDGVNDVSAMKVSDVSTAMLGGYGDESSAGRESLDVEEERRMELLSRQRIGGNRKMTRRQISVHERAGVGDSAAASSARIKAAIEEANREILERALARQAEEGSDMTQPVYSFRDLKDLVGLWFQALRAERVRSRQIRKGGAAAARILAQEDERRQNLARNNGVPSDAGIEFDQIDVPQKSAIRPGEASLAAAFSCLRPSISGVEALLRTGVAASACCLSVEQTIALNCLMSCFNLAFLYKDGFRYGRFMWNVELFFFTFIDQAGYLASCTPRPRLSRTRVDESLFHPESIMLVFSQAFVHLMTLYSGVRVANVLEKAQATPETTRRQLIRWRTSQKQKDDDLPVFSRLTQSLIQSQSSDEIERIKEGGLNIFRRPPFQPNYATNIVFLLSIFQFAVSAITTHKGRPFYGSILESRKLCVSIASAIAFAVLCVSESFPAINAMLELRLLPSRRHRMTFLALFLIDFTWCYLTNWVSSSLWRKKWKDLTTQSTVGKTAADEEERLLSEEVTQNRSLLIGILILLITAVSNSLLR